MRFAFLYSALLIAIGLASTTYAESIQHNQVIPYTLAEKGVPAHGWSGTIGRCNATMLPGTTVSVEYHVAAKNAVTGESVCGASIPVGTPIRFAFTPHVPQDVAWSATGYAYGTPYGYWAQGGDFSAWESGTENRCVAPNYYHRRSGAGHAGGEWSDQYAALVVAPPSKNVALDARALTCTDESNDGKLCTVSEDGSVTATFRFDPTFGYFFAGSVWSKSANKTVCDIPDLPALQRTGSNNADANSTIVWSDCGGFNSPYQVVVPQQTISCPIAVLPAPESPESHAPTPPTLQSGGACTIGTPHSINFVSTDPDGDSIRYGLDWNADGSINEWVPPAGYVASGQSQSASRTYSMAGEKTVKVLAQDEGALSSDWATLTFSCTETPPPAGQCTDNADNDGDGLIDSLDPDCTATAGLSEFGTSSPPPPLTSVDLSIRVLPSLVRGGQTTQVHWSSTALTSCTVTAPNGDSWNALQSPVGGETSSPISQETTYTLSCVDSEGLTVTKTATVRTVPIWRER